MTNQILLYLFSFLILFNIVCIIKIVIDRLRNSNSFIIPDTNIEQNRSCINYADDIKGESIDNGKVIELFPAKDNQSQQNTNDKIEDKSSILNKFINKQKVVKKTKNSLDVLNHILLWGPPGLGKTTLAKVITNELNLCYSELTKGKVKIKLIETTPIELRNKTDLDHLIKSIKYGDVVFIDEIHGISRTVEECLYSVMQDFQYSMRQETENRKQKTDGFITYKVPKFTLIGATTLAGLLNRPLRERFGIEVELEPPCSETIMKILNDQETINQPKYFSEYHGQDKAKDILMLHIKALYRSVYEDIYGISKTAQKIIADRSCNTPRIAKQLYSNARAKALVEGHKEIQTSDVLYVLELLGIDENGVSNAGKRIIKYLLDRGNIPIGADNLADVGRVSLADLKDMIEPRLIQLGLLERTKKGRILTEKALRLYGKYGVQYNQQRG